LAWFYHSHTLRNTTWKNSTSRGYTLTSKAALNEAAWICPIELTSMRNAPPETSLSLQREQMAERKVTSPGAVLLTVCVAQFMVPLMLTAVGVALPSIGREFNASAQQLGLVEQLYILSPAISMLTFGRLGDLVGRVKIFITGLVLFTVLTASLGFVESIDMLLIQRFFQGMGASMLLSGSMALVASAFPVEIRGRKVGIVSAFTYSGLSSGPVLGGFITSHLGWRYVFWLVVPFGVAACLLCVLRLRDDVRFARRETIDWYAGFLPFNGRPACNKSHCPFVRLQHADGTDRFCCVFVLGFDSIHGKKARPPAASPPRLKHAVQRGLARVMCRRAALWSEARAALQCVEV